MPAACLKPLGDIFGKGNSGGAGQRDVILVVDINQFAQAQMSGQRRCLFADPFHQVAISAENVSVVVYNFMSGTVITRR